MCIYFVLMKVIDGMNLKYFLVIVVIFYVWFVLMVYVVIFVIIGVFVWIY